MTSRRISTKIHNLPQLTAIRHRLRSMFAELTHKQLCVYVQYVRFISCPKLKRYFDHKYCNPRMRFLFCKLAVCAAILPHTHIALWQNGKMAAHTRQASNLLQYCNHSHFPNLLPSSRYAFDNSYTFKIIKIGCFIIMRNINVKIVN